MAVKIRLARHGKKRKPFYHIVVADGRAPRNGKYIEKLGIYNPVTNPATIELDFDRASYWMGNGAIPTDTCNAILRYKGVLYKKHLDGGVRKGALTQEQADAKLEAWLSEKAAKIDSKITKLADNKDADKKAKLEAEIKVKAAVAAKLALKNAPEVVEVVEAEAPVAEVVAEAPVAEVVAEAPVAEVVAEAPVAEVVAEAPVAEVVAEAPVAEVVAEAPVAEVVAEAPVAEVVAEAPAIQLVIVEGIGPKVQELLHESGIVTISDLASAPVEKLKEVLDAKGGIYAAMNPETWAQQAALARDGKMDELKKWQDELDGGKVTNE